MKDIYEFYNMDCVEGCRKRLPDNSIDLIVTDPPYGISGHTLHKHYNRNEDFVLDGYIEVSEREYPEFSRNWIKEAERILRPGGSIYIVSGYTNLIHILNALHQTSLREVNHIIWKYNFGVYARKKYISSHYHILYYVKPGGEPTFNTHCRYGAQEKKEESGSLNYEDREDVWIINREYKPGKIKNKNELPTKLLQKIIQYSSNEGDLICDLFLGSFSTAKVALGLNRRATGFEKSKIAFDHHIKEMKKIVPGYLLKDLRIPDATSPLRQGESWSDAEKEALAKRYSELLKIHKMKKKVMPILCKEFDRGYWSIQKALKNMESANAPDSDQSDLFD
ncbi:site-specific DNA-methyltransferase [Candidatus Sumerlaeota bacterium]|nr:site-specific DNA-methyltransferase [Candidatus Sumerlaeota bacterium]